MKKEIYLIRHGETDFNKQGIVQGKGVDSVLNANGKLQSNLFYAAYRHIPFEKIYVSNLIRTYQSIEPFALSGIPVIKHEGLDEISWGIHEGQKSGESFKRFYEVLHSWKRGDIAQAIEEGESPPDVQQRQLLFIDELKRTPESTILICSHGRAMRILLCTMLNQHLMEMDNYPHRNLSLYKLNFTDNVFHIELFNATQHVESTF